jgi:hypothetical protein
MQISRILWNAAENIEDPKETWTAELLEHCGFLLAIFKISFYGRE